MWDDILSWAKSFLAADWADFFRAVIGAGIGTSLVQGVIPLHRDRVQRFNQAAQLATRIVQILEKYARTCGNFIEQHDNATHLPDEEFPEWSIKLPELPDLPDDIEGWRALDLKLGVRIRSLQGHIEERQKSLQATAEYCIDELGDKIPEHAAETGLEALGLATPLRRMYRLGTAEPLYKLAESLNERRPKVTSKTWRLGIRPVVRSLLV